MTCDECRELVSARLDAEAADWQVAAAEKHLAGCAACRVWVAAAEALSWRLRVRPADQVPDLSFAVMTAARDRHLVGRHRPPGKSLQTAVRVGLVLVGLALLALAVPELNSRAHLGNEVASWTVAAAVGLVGAAASPRRVVGMLPVFTAAVVVLAAITLRDLAAGQAHLEEEASHALLLAGVGLLWLLRERRGGRPDRDESALPPNSSHPGAGRRAA